MPASAPPGGEQRIREAVLRYSREVAFAAARVYARAAESRGAWDARLEALVVDALLRGEADDVLRSRAAALGWGGLRPVTVVVGRHPGRAVGERRRRRCAVPPPAARVDALVGVQGDRLVVVLGHRHRPARRRRASCRPARAGPGRRRPGGPDAGRGGRLGPGGAGRRRARPRPGRARRGRCRPTTCCPSALLQRRRRGAPRPGRPGAPPAGGRPVPRCSTTVAAYLEPRPVAGGRRAARSSSTPTRSGTGCGGVARGHRVGPDRPAGGLRPAGGASSRGRLARARHREPT